MIDLRMLSKIRRPSRTASTIVEKRSSWRMMSEASRLTSVPWIPMAIPTSACLSATASLTPSPVIAATSPAAWSICTSRSLCSGETRARTEMEPAFSGGVASNSRPSRMISPPSRTIPISRATAPAVTTWSPVTMTTRMPASRHCDTAPATSGRGGSSIPAKPTKASVSRVGPKANARVRIPRSADDRTFARHSSRIASVIGAASPFSRTNGTSSSTRSGAPLRQTHPSCQVIIRIVDESKGSTDRLGCAARMSATSSPTKSSSAASIGSPTLPCSVTSASLHRAAARRSSGSARSSGVSVIRTVMRFIVSVPVLSVQITVVAPSVSTAERLRTSAFFAAMRLTPSASVIVATKGSPSGTAATASAIPVSIIDRMPRPCTIPTKITTAAMPKVMRIRKRLKRERRSSSGVDCSPTD